MAGDIAFCNCCFHYVIFNDAIAFKDVYSTGTSSESPSFIFVVVHVLESLTEPESSRFVRKRNAGMIYVVEVCSRLPFLCFFDFFFIYAVLQ